MEKLVYSLMAVVMLGFSSCTVIVSHNDNAAMNEMVKNGSDPIAARCAVKSADSKTCAIYAAKNKGGVSHP